MKTTTIAVEKKLILYVPEASVRGLLVTPKNASLFFELGGAGSFRGEVDVQASIAKDYGLNIAKELHECAFGADYKSGFIYLKSLRKLSDDGGHSQRNENKQPASGPESPVVSSPSLN